MKLRLLLVVGTRPNFIKAAPLVAELSKAQNKIEFQLLHTGQHYDDNMSEVFFQDLSIPKPDINLGVGSGTNSKQTGKIMQAFEPELVKYKPNVVVVFGDVISTFATAYVARTHNVPVAHVEAGLRSFDLAMSEEVNRILTDQISNYLFTHSPEANDNLRNEGVDKRRIYYVGNIMIDTLVSNLEKIRSLKIHENYGLKEKNYGVLTLHRAENVDVRDKLLELIKAVNKAAEQVPIVFPIHPRTKERINKFKLDDLLLKNIIMVEPLGYLHQMSLMAHSLFVMTDSGGIQEETTFLGVPCFTLRENTERPITITQGTNTLISGNYNRLLSEIRTIKKSGSRKIKKPKFWDGQTAARIVSSLTEN